LDEVTLTERYPRRTLGSIWRGVLALLSLLLVVLVLYLYPPDEGAVIVQFFLLVGCGFTVMTFAVRFFPFFRIRGSLAKKGSVGRRVLSASEEVRRAIVLLLATAILCFSPILLIPFLPSIEWFSTVVGGIFGIMLGETLFLAVIRQWERSNHSDIYRYRIYSHGLERVSLVESGLRISPRQRRRE
jgi:hypothetical protein